MQTLSSNESSSTFLLSNKRLQKGNAKFILQMINDGVEEFCITRPQVVLTTTEFQT